MAAPGAAGRPRLDELLVERGLAPNRSRARALILAGRVTSGGERLDKAGCRLPADAPLEVAPGRRFVGRGGHKLEAALADFGVDPAGRDALDVGASTGGFTQVLLEAGARRVIALDVGRGQLDYGLRQDERVHALEGCNARYLEPQALPFPPTLAAVDVSFISLEQVLPAVIACLIGQREVVALVKPQFEVGRGEVGKGGIVRDPALHARVLGRLTAFAAARSWAVAGLTDSAILGAEGNREFFVHLRAVPGARGLDAATTTARIASLCSPREAGS